MMPPENAPFSALSRETATTEPTLYAWQRQVKGQILTISGGAKKAQNMVFRAQICSRAETAPPNAAELAEWCRRIGRYPEQISGRRRLPRLPFGQSECHETGTSATSSVEGRQKPMQQLAKELQRKEKALAEAAAPPILRKKPERLEETKGTIDRRPGAAVICIVNSQDGAIGLRDKKALDERGLRLRTFQCSADDGDAVLVDGRTITARPPPQNNLSEG